MYHYSPIHPFTPFTHSPIHPSIHSPYSPIYPFVIHPSLHSQVTVVQNVHRSTEFSTLTPPDERDPILISQLPEYTRALHANSDHLFSEEYEVLGIKSPSLAHQASQLPWNQPKNRYANINSCKSHMIAM